MILNSTFNLVIISLLLGAQWLMRPSVFLKVARPVFWALLVLPALLAIYFSYQQYQLWSVNPLTRLLLPPHQNVSYFISYSAVTFFLPIVINVLLASVALLIFTWMNRRFQGRFFEEVEPYLIGLAILLSGGYWMVSLLLIIGATFLGTLVNFVMKRGRFSMYYLWLPAAVFTIATINLIKMLPR